jgi:hypothetical protein
MKSLWCTSTDEKPSNTGWTSRNSSKGSLPEAPVDRADRAKTHHFTWIEHPKIEVAGR